MTQKAERKQIKESPVAENRQKSAGAATPLKTGISNLKLCILLGMVSFLVYANTLNNGYAGDDDIFVNYNRLVNMGIKGIPEILMSPRMAGTQAGNNDTYRPIPLMTFAAEKEVFDDDPALRHLVNILIFSGCVILLFLFLDKLMVHKKTTVAFITALIFSVHPVHTEVVANIKSRDELLCFLFAFRSLNSFLKYFDTGKHTNLIVGFLTLCLSLFSKETSASFIIITPLVVFFYRSGDKKRSYITTAAALISFAVFLGVRTMVLGVSHGDNALSASADNQLVSVPSGASGLATAIRACGYYIKLMFIPNPLLVTYSFSTIPFVNFSNPYVWLSIGAYLTLLVTGIYRLIRHQKDPWAFSVLFFIVTIALFSNIFFLVPAFFAERFLFFGSAGICMLMALLIEKWGTGQQINEAGAISGFNKIKMLLLLIPLVIIFGSMTSSRNMDWENDYILHTTDLEKAPENMRISCNLGFVLSNNLNNDELRPEIKLQMIEKGIYYFKRAIAINQEYANAHAGLGQLYLIKQMYDSAEVHSKKALMHNDRSLIALKSLGSVYLNANKYNEALAMYRKLHEISPGDITATSNMGVCHFYLRKYDSAILNIRKAIVEPTKKTPMLYQLMSNSFSELGKTDSAEKYAHLAQRL